ncbi:hypothetical protein E4T39_00971 [Aureobasidium subglaciale]|nr:hypothetical protein E4T39_00971 [Aureobasidium subglaciale]
MSLSRSPSPKRGGGWASPGLNANFAQSRSTTPVTSYSQNHTVTWASAQARSHKVNGYPAYQEGGPGFFGKHMRNLSASLPFFNNAPKDERQAEKEKAGRGKWTPARGGYIASFKALLGRHLLRSKTRFILVLVLLLFILCFYTTPLHYWYRRSSWLGGGSKFVVILAANMGGGVMEWKGPREWAIERDSVRNKKNYVHRWGYELEIVDMSTKKRYAHEWRESWEKVDTIRNAMRKYPQAECRFWWLDLNTFIMEPSYSLQQHIFNNLNDNVYRDINLYNPLNISHPPTAAHLDPESLSAIGDGKPDSINLIVPQDCGGFNLGSFFVKRSAWTDRLLDIWWDPVGYEQKHMEWEHKEQDALEYMYTNQPWVRPHLAFIPQRKVNSFPPGACGDNGEDMNIHYHEHDRDFVVNMAGCEWGRDCWGEMYNYRQLSNRLNRNKWEKVKDGVSGAFSFLKTKKKEITGTEKDEEKKES